jgi:hypothetical protein
MLHVLRSAQPSPSSLLNAQTCSRMLHDHLVAALDARKSLRKELESIYSPKHLSEML